MKGIVLSAFVARPNRKGKPSERMGRKTFDLRIVFSNEFLVFSFPKHYKLTTKHYYGGWVAEVGQKVLSPTLSSALIKVGRRPS